MVPYDGTNVTFTGTMGCNCTCGGCGCHRNVVTITAFRSQAPVWPEPPPKKALPPWWGLIEPEPTPLTWSPKAMVMPRLRSLAAYPQFRRHAMRRRRAGCLRNWRPRRSLG